MEKQTQENQLAENNQKNNAPFVSWVYNTTDPLLQPFSGMFPSPMVSGGFVLEFSAIFGLIVYTLIGYLITEFASFLEHQSRTREESQKK